MKLAEKIKEFERIEDLISEINADKVTNEILSRRYPVRLIFLQRFETFRVLIERLSSIGIENYHLERDLPHPDGWITKDTLISIVKDLSKDTAVVPFSEIVRFYSKEDFKNFFNQLLLIENIELSRRIYLPLIGVEERFERDFFQDFTRKDESAPYWKISRETPNSIKVYLTSQTLTKKIGHYETIVNTEEWLKFWKKKSPCDVICYSKPLNLFCENTLSDTIFTIEQVDNQKNLIEKIFNIKVPIPFDNSEILFWEKLLSLLNKDFTTFKAFVKDYFKVTSLTIYTLLEHWLKSNDFEKWLLKHFVLSQICLETKYIYKVFESLSDYSDHTLLKSLYQRIFSLEIKEEFINVRLALIQQYARFKQINLSDETINELNSSIKSLTDYRQALLLTTGMFQFEKVYILELFAKGKIDNIDLLSHRFPEILYYNSECSFDNLNNENEWVLEYLREYKKSKLHNTITSRLNEILLLKNANDKSFYDWYHTFESIQSIFHSNKVDKVIWIDALGIEWVSFIENYIINKKHDLNVIKKNIGVANLPTSTEQNKFHNVKYIQDFDSHIHSNPYSFPNSIIKQFEEIKRIIDTCIILDSQQTIAIVSDHGLTALSRLAPSKKYGKDDSHEGRFIEVKNKDHIPDTDYIIHKSEIDQKNYLIALKHNSLGKKPIREVHGGVTPEEVLVPFIVISNKTEGAEIDYSITIEKTEIPKKEPIISIAITPKPATANIEIKEKLTKLSFNKTTQKWEANLDKSLSGKIPIKIKTGKIEKAFTINIISGIIEEDLF
ncbi:MAG: BREX-4 system phosphatase PglZ [Bacteroidales bacterium]